MDYRFLFDDGDNNLVNENGEPIVDDVDMLDCLPMETLTDLTEYRQIERNRNSGKSTTTEKKQRKVASEEKDDDDDESINLCRRYRVYSLQDREAFFAEWIEKPGTSIASIARSLGILPRTAQKWVREYNESGSVELPLPKAKNTSKPKLNEEHKTFLKDLVDQDPSSSLNDMLDSLTESFEGLIVSKSSLHRFVKNDCALSFKLVRKESVERNSVSKIQQRFDFVTQVMDSDVDYLSNCVFIDEAAFNINMKKSGGWAPKGVTPVVKTPTTRAENRTIVGAICYHGVVQMSLRKPKAPGQSKKRRIEGEGPEKVTKGTVTGHYKQFLFDLIDCLDKHPILNGAYLVMDNASIHKNPSISRIVSARGYRILYLPPFSPELNPIEQFWNSMKAQLKREKLLRSETLTQRIKEAANSVPLEYIQNSIQHSVNCFSNCLNKDPL